MSIAVAAQRYHQKKYGFGFRHIQYLLLIVTMIIIFGQQTILTVAVLAMTEESPPDLSIPTYPNWTNTNTLLSSFFWGYIFLQIPAGQLGERYGPKWFLVGTMVIGSIFVTLIPLGAQVLGFTGVIICCVLQGMNQAFLSPSLYILISKWAPIYERSRITSIVYGSCGLSVVISTLFSGAVCGSKLGWPYVFYFYGAGGILWAVVFGIFGSNSPSNHKRISTKERKYIESGSSVNDNQKRVPTPWISVLTSVPIWAILLSVSAQSWCLHTLLSDIPTFMAKFMDLDISSNSKLASLPYLVKFLIAMTTAAIGDKLIAYKMLSTGTTRKLFNSLGLVVPSISLFGLGFVTKDQKDIAVFLLLVAVGFSTFINSGSGVNVIDVAPNHVGTVKGLVGAVSQVFAIVAPLTVEFLGKDKTDIILWRNVFWLSAGIGISSGLFFIVFASGEVQKWNNENSQDSNEECLEEATTDL